MRVEAIGGSWQFGAMVVLCAAAVSAGPGRYALQLEGRRTSLAVEPSADGHFGVLLSQRGEGTDSLRFMQPQPLRIQVVAGGGEATWTAGAYHDVTGGPRRLVCTSDVTSPHGSRFSFRDVYSACGSDAIGLHRTVTVQQAAPEDIGFSSSFGLYPAASGGIAAFEYFAPAIWYKDGEHNPPHTLASDYTDEYFLFREDRMPLPLVMLREPRSGIWLALVHSAASPRTFAGEQGGDWIIDSRMQFASLGVYNNARPTLAILYPGSEGEITYVRGAPARDCWSRRAHPVQDGFQQIYEVVLKTGTSSGFSAAMHDSWRTAFDLYSPRICDADLDAVYQDNIDLLDEYWGEVNGAPGLPFAVELPDGEVRARNYQCGFIGQQIPLGFQMIRYGLHAGAKTFTRRGRAIVDFWADNCLSASGLPRTWYDPQPGTWRHYLTYPRIAADGMLGMLDAWRLLQQQRGEAPDNWLRTCRPFGDWLVEHQNPAGSYYRQYDFRGPESPPVENEMSKLSTTHPIRFLVELAAATGQHEYLEAAVRAGEFSLKHIHRPGLYLGGVVDNPNVPDSQASAIAMQAFLSLFDATGDSKWLDAAAQAAKYAVTWSVAWNIPRADGDEAFDYPADATTAGLNLIAVGHSGADMWNSVYCFDYYRLYLLTGNEHFLQMARLLLHNTKQTIDTDGALGYKHPGLQTEVMDLRGHSVRAWLPWLTFSTIDPMVRLKDTFGTWHIDRIQKLPMEKRLKLNDEYAARRGIWDMTDGDE